MGIEIKACSEPGYQPQVDYGHWRVALANYAEHLEKNRLTFLERHMETDEVFVLLCGTAGLLIGLEKEEIVFEPCKIYNVKKETWHRVFMEENAKILIVENVDTSQENTQIHMLKR